MAKPLVSVISAYYNREDYVNESVQSLLEQTYENLEIIIIDDGSTDNTYQRLAQFSDSRLKIVTHENMGFVKSFRKAIELSKGEYIAVHGSGDISFPERIEKQAALLQENDDIGVVGCYVKDIDALSHHEYVRDFDVPKRALAELKRRNLFTHGEVMYRRSLYDEVGGYRTFFNFSQDYDLWLRMSLVSNFASVKEVLYARFKLGDGIELNLERKAMQNYLTDFALQCIDYRLEHGKDLLDIYQERAGFFRKRSAKVSTQLHILSKTALFQRQVELAEKLNRWSIRERRGLANSIVQVFMYIASQNVWLEARSFELLFKARELYQSYRSPNSAVTS